jgi:NitT/TauT family transport system ATP-binding protein
LVTREGVGKVVRGRSGAWEAVKDFSLSLEEGAFFCLLGTSGCGRSAVLNMLARFEAPTSGRIPLAGRSVTAPGADRGVVFQGHDSRHDWLGALDNIAVGLRLRGVPRAERRASAERFLKMVGPTGQDAKHPSELSGCMKQRSQIARVLANDPRISLVDEPFGALDAQTRAVRTGALSRIWAETRKTVRFIIHDIEEACALATRVGVMKRGPGGTLKAAMPIDLPFPRERTSEGFLPISPPPMPTRPRATTRRWSPRCARAAPRSGRKAEDTTP